jgi:short-subunit dehydrogenase involved in D-alanine esterification of teichoic acids
MPPTRSVIITGGDAGLGFETAKVIARDRGAMVVIASRYPRLGQGAVARLTAFGGRAAFLPLDLAAQASIREFVDAYRNAGLPLLKGVICNAGMQNVAAPTKTIEGYETNFAVNHLGHYLLTRLLFDDMAQDGRITFVSSGTHDPKERTGLPAPVYERADAVAHDFESSITAGLKRYTTSKALQCLLRLRVFPSPFRIGRSSPVFDQGQRHRPGPHACDRASPLMARPAAVGLDECPSLPETGKQQRPQPRNVRSARRRDYNWAGCRAGSTLFLQPRGCSVV